MKIPPFEEIQRIYIVSIPLFVSVSILIVVLLFYTPQLFPSDNARYAYSAIFQGFAAILALTITAILITLQNMHSQKFQIEEQIFKILDERFPTYIQESILRLKKAIKTKKFINEFSKYVASSNNLPGPDQKFLVKRIVNRLKRKIKFLDEREKHEKKLRQFFVISVGLIFLIMIYSLTALIIIPPEDYTRADWIVQEGEMNWSDGNTTIIHENGTTSIDNELNLRIGSPTLIFTNANNPLGLNPFHVLFVCVLLVLISLQVILGFFFVEIIKIWKLRPE